MRIHYVVGYEVRVLAIVVNINKLVVDNKLLPFTINSYPIRFSNALVSHLLRISIAIMVLPLPVEMGEDGLDSSTAEFPPVDPQPNIPSEVRVEQHPPVSAQAQEWDVAYEERMQGIRQLQLDRGRRRAPSVNSIVSEHPSHLDPQHHRHPVLPLAPSVSDPSAAPVRRGLAAVPDFHIDERIDLTAYDFQDSDNYLSDNVSSAVGSLSLQRAPPVPSHSSLAKVAVPVSREARRPSAPEPTLLPPPEVRQPIHPKQAAPVPQQSKAHAVRQPAATGQQVFREPTAGSVPGPQNPTPEPGASASLSVTPGRGARAPHPEVRFP